MDSRTQIPSTPHQTIRALEKTATVTVCHKFLGKSSNGPKILTPVRSQRPPR